MNESWVSHVSHMYESCHRSNRGYIICMSHVTHQSEMGITARQWMSHISCMNESCHISNQGQYHSAATLRGRTKVRERVMSHVWISHVTHMDESRHTHECVMSHVGMSRLTGQSARKCWGMWNLSHLTDAGFVSRKWVTSHIWVGLVTHKNESCHT